MHKKSKKRSKRKVARARDVKILPITKPPKDTKIELELEDDIVKETFEHMKIDLLNEFVILDGQEDESSNINGSNDDCIDDRFMTQKVVDVMFSIDTTGHYYEYLRQMNKYHMDGFYDLIIEYININEDEFIDIIKEKFFIIPNNIESINYQIDECSNITMSIFYMSLSDE